MHTTPELLDALARKLGGATDYRLSKILDTSSTSVVSSWRKGRSHLSPRYALKVALQLNWPAEYVLACVEHEREPAKDVKVIWARLARAYMDKLSAAVVMLIVAGGAFFSPAQSHAQATGAVHDIHYTKYEAFRRRARLWKRRQWWSDLGHAARRAFVTWLPIHSPAG